MSPSIWTQCAGRSRIRPLASRPWRAVEAQHVVTTRKLVDSSEEQEILEKLIEGHKPPPPVGDEFTGLHYLLSTPFRYPPLPHGSRFGTRAERSIWYGAEERRSAFAEVAYYRLLFLAGTAAALEPIVAPLSVFHVAIRTRRGTDLTVRPFAAQRNRIASPTAYTASQRLGREMREAGVEAFRYPSARDVRSGVNVGVFSPGAFGARRPGGLQTWYCVASQASVDFSRADLFKHERFSFPRSDFLVNGVLPRPAV